METFDVFPELFGLEDACTVHTYVLMNKQ